MKRIAVAGLGIMGHGIAENFIKNGYEVTVWNRSKNKAEDLLAKGAKWAQSPKEATTQADIIFEVTADDDSSKQTWTNKDGILAGANEQKVLITCATLSVDWVENLYKKCKQRNFTFFDMPMTGSRIGAESGQLILLVGGDHRKLNAIRPDLMAIAKEVSLYGPVGAGTKFKLILNTLQAIHVSGLGEAMRLAKRVGLNENQVGNALSDRPGGLATTLAWQNYQSEPKQVNFAVEWIAKDLRYSAEMAGNMKHPLLDDVLKQLDKAIDQGYAQADWTKINKL
jgi:3-hydroxyisobutyrate dehydrogenase-like beta-hydroxyacid dehydrogenase